MLLNKQGTHLQPVTSFVRIEHQHHRYCSRYGKRRIVRYDNTLVTQWVFARIAFLLEICFDEIFLGFQHSDEGCGYRYDEGLCGFPRIQRNKFPGQQSRPPPMSTARTTKRIPSRGHAFSPSHYFTNLDTQHFSCLGNGTFPLCKSACSSSAIQQP